MFGEISIWAWMGLAMVFGIGGGTGFFIARQLKDKRILDLENNLNAARNELAGYRGDVNQHFLKTSLLLGKLTNDYREVYEHLATGAQKLCKGKPDTPKLDLPETKILPPAETIEPETPAINLADEAIEQIEPEINEALTDDTDSENSATAAQSADESSAEQTTENPVEQKADRPAPEDIPDSETNDDDVHLGVESSPGVDTELHKTHPAIH